MSFAFDSINSYDAKLKKANKQLEELTKKLSTAKIYEKGQINKELQTTNDSILKYKQIKEKYLQEQMKTSAILNNALKTLEKNKAAIQKESEQTIEKIIKEYSK